MSTDLFTLILSPVKIAWSTRKLLEETESRRQSAGILSPTATLIISPGTSSDACIRATSDERKTLASSGEYSFRAYVEIEIDFQNGSPRIQSVDLRQLPFQHSTLG